MFKVDLQNELQKEANKSINVLKADNALLQVRGLLEDGAADDRRILKLISPNCTEMQMIENKGTFIELEKLKFENGSFKVFDISDIKKIACNYRMRLLTSKSYIGQIPSTVILDFKKYLKDTNRTADNEYDRLFILAPKELFNLKEKEKPVPPPSMIRYDPEPILFYRLRQDDTKYVMISKWGKDFTIARRVLGFLTQNRWGKTMPVIMAFLIGIWYTFFGGIIAKHLLLSKLANTLNESVIILVGTFILSCILSGIFFGYDEDVEESKTCWNEDYKTAF